MSRANSNASKVFNQLCQLWFDEEGDKSHYLKVLKKHKIELFHLCYILSGTTIKTTKAFKDFYDVLFDDDGNKMFYLHILQKNGIEFSTLSVMVHRTESHCVKILGELFDLWFDYNGKKTWLIFCMELAQILQKLSKIFTCSGLFQKETNHNM